MDPVDIELYYGGGVTYIKLSDDHFFAVSDDAQKRGIVNTCPTNVKTTEQADHGGETGFQARTMISTACEVVRAMRK